MDSSEYTYICGKCNYKTNLKNSFDKHCLSVLHKTGKRKTRKDKLCDEYSCSDCNYSTTVKVNFTMHRLNNHSTIEEKKKYFTYYCDLCNFGTFGKTFYDKHLQTKKHITFVKKNNE